MSLTTLVCQVAGHKWRKERREQRDVIVCRRCAVVSTVEEQRQRSTFGPGSDTGFSGGGP